MGLQKNFTASTGKIGSYHNFKKLLLKDDNKVVVYVDTYGSEAAYRSDSTPMVRRLFTATGEDFENFFSDAKLKEQDMSLKIAGYAFLHSTPELADAQDVLE